MSENNNKSGLLPEKLVVTLRAGGVFFALANVICVAILAWTYLSVKLEPKTLSVTGSARKAIVSDRVTWTGTICAKDVNLVKAYDTLKAASVRIRWSNCPNWRDVSRTSRAGLSRRHKQNLRARGSKRRCKTTNFRVLAPFANHLRRVSLTRNLSAEGTGLIQGLNPTGS